MYYVKDFLNNMIWRIDVLNLIIYDKIFIVFGEGSFGFVKKMMYCGVEVVVKVFKGDVIERYLLYEVFVM